jgi:hypothetical protein
VPRLLDQVHAFRHVTADNAPTYPLVEAAKASDAAGLARALHPLRAAFDSLTEEANLFLSEVDRHVAAERVDEERFLAHKHALLTRALSTRARLRCRARRPEPMAA